MTARARPTAVRSALPLLALAAAVLASLALGARATSPATVLQVLLASDGSAEAVVVRQLRVPRTAVGLLVGAALGAAGALVQGLTRNPLAEPGLLGVNAGAALGVVLAMWLLGIGSLVGWVWFALVGAAAAAVLVHVLGASGRAAASPARLVLAGVATTALLSSLTSAVVLADRGTLDAYRFWVVGSLAGRDADLARQVAPFVVSGLVLALLAARALDAMALGDDAAAALGLRVGPVRAAASAAVVLLAGSATAAAGPLVFVGLVVPHLVRRWTGPLHRRLVPASMVTGAVVVLVADVVGRLAAPPGEVPVGVVVAALGGPVLVLVVRRGRLVGR